jgi:two-component system NarL family sensor kinase
MVSCKQAPIPVNELHQQVDYFNRQFISYQKVDIQKAELYIDSLNLVSEKNNYALGISISKLNHGIIEQLKGNYSIAIKEIELALEVFENENNDSLIARSYALMGSSYWQISDYGKAMQYFLDALKIYEQLNYKNEIASSYNSISMVYQSKYQLALAEEYAKKSFDMITTQKPNTSQLSIYHNMANIYGMQAKYSDALKMDSIGLVLCNQLNAQYSKSMFYDNMSNCYYYSNEFDKSIEYHSKAISIDSIFNNKKQLGDSYCNLGAVYEAKKETDNAIKYYLKSIENCKAADYKLGVKNAYQLLATLYSSIHQPELAYQALLNSISIKDSIINEKTENKIVELRTLYEMEKKQQQIIQQNLKISRRNILIGTLFVIFILSIFTYVLLINRYKLKQDKKLQIELFKEEEKRTLAILESEENERQRIARELHDGVGQLLSATKLNLSAVYSNTSNLKILQSLTVLDESIKEIRNISHNLLPDVLLKYGLISAIDKFVQKINQTNQLNVQFECNGFEESSLNNTEKLMMYRIIQESVNNTIKYAHANEVMIQLSADEREISLMVQDNGKGFDIKNINTNSGIGFKNMQLRTEFLKGKIDIESSINNGTTIFIEIPLT